MTASREKIDSVLRLVDRELWIVTAAAGGRRGGLVATWVAAASIDPQRPVLLAGLAPNHFTSELVQASGAFGVHLLRPDQVELAWSFARDSGRARDKLAGLETISATTGAPILADCLAWCDCRVFARYDAGDRLYFWADVVAAGEGFRFPGTGSSKDEGAATLLREKAFFAALTQQQRQTLVSGREADVALQRPWFDAWRAAAEAGAGDSDPRRRE